jgi:hypothetical protein
MQQFGSFRRRFHLRNANRRNPVSYVCYLSTCVDADVVKRTHLSINRNAAIAITLLHSYLLHQLKACQ